MSDYKKIIDKELESMTFNELKNRRSINMIRKKSIKKITAAALTLFAAAVLAVPAFASGFFDVSDIIGISFPTRAGKEKENAESYMFDAEADAEDSLENFTLSFGDVICDGNLLITQLFINKKDGGSFTDDEYQSFSISGSLYMQNDGGIPDEETRVYSFSDGNYLSEDRRTLIINSKYFLRRTALTGDVFCIKITNLRSLVINSDNMTEFIPLDGGDMLIRFAVPEISAPRKLIFRDKKGEYVFAADITPLSLVAFSESPLFKNSDSFSEYDIDEWNIYPKFYDENMEFTENVYNRNVFVTDSETGVTYPSEAHLGYIMDDNYILMEFGDDPGLDSAKFVKWLGCTAAIPDASEKN